MYVRQLMVSYRRRQVPPAPRLGSILTPRDAAALLISLIGEEAVEVFGILCLTTKHRLIAYHEVSRGGINRTSASPREVFQAALLAHAAVIVVGHNHPSGDPTPSPDDIALTRRLIEAGETLGIDIVDHLIVTDEGYYSFKEGGRV